MSRTIGEAHVRCFDNRLEALLGEVGLETGFVRRRDIFERLHPGRKNHGEDRDLFAPDPMMRLPFRPRIKTPVLLEVLDGVTAVGRHRVAAHPQRSILERGHAQGE